MMVIYTADCIIASKDPHLRKTEVQELAKNLRSQMKETWMNTFVSRLNIGVMTFTATTDRANTNCIRVSRQNQAKDTPALSSKILQRDVEGPDHNQLNFLEESTCPTIAYESTNVQGMRQIPGCHTSTQIWELAGTSWRHETWTWKGIPMHLCGCGVMLISVEIGIRRRHTLIRLQQNQEQDLSSCTHDAPWLGDQRCNQRQL